MNKLRNVLSEDSALLADLHVDKFEFGARILITGASGLIGINLLAFFCSQKLLDRDLRIFVSTNSIDGRRFINSIFPDHDITYLSADLTSTNSATLGFSFDYIFHLATYGQPGRFVENSIKTMELNSIGLTKLFNDLSPGGRLFFSSSSEIYSGNVQVPHIESDIGSTTTIHPRACYIEAKRFGEAYCYLQSAQGVFAYSGRISLAYGPGFRLGDKRVLNEFVVNATKGGRIDMIDSGSAVRVYCYVSDTIDMILRLVKSEHYEPINLGGVNKISILELASEIGRQCGAIVNPGPSAKGLIGAPQVVYSSQKLASTVLNKVSYVPIEEGIRKTLRWAQALFS